MLRISSRKATTGAVCSPERQMSGVDTSLLKRQVVFVVVQEGMAPKPKVS